MRQICLTGFLCLAVWVAYGQKQPEQTFYVTKAGPQPREYYRTVTIPDHTTCKESMSYALDTNLVPGDTIKLELGEYRIGAYELVCMNKGEIFKVGGYRGIMNESVFKNLAHFRRLPNTELYLEITVLLTAENKKVTLKNPWSYRLTW